MAWAEGGRESRWPVGWAKRSVPTLQADRWVEMVGTARRTPLPTLTRTSLSLRHAFQKRLFRRLDRIGGSDMHPDAVEPQAEQPLLLVGAVEHPGQRELAL